MDSSIIFPIILQVLGLLIIIAEIILPSGGLLSVLAAGLFGYSLYTVFNTMSVNTGFALVAIDVVCVPITILVGLKLLVKSPVTLRKELSSAEGVTAQSSELDAYVGKEGVAVTDLRPSGIALINDERLDVVTEGKYVEKGAGIVVVSISGNQIIVNQTSN